MKPRTHIHRPLRVAKTNGLSQTTSNVFDFAGRTIATIDPAGLVTTYRYPDPLTTVTIALGGLLTNTTIAGSVEDRAATGHRADARLFCCLPAPSPCTECTFRQTLMADAPAGRGMAAVFATFCTTCYTRSVTFCP